MRVADLIKKLNTFPQEADIAVRTLERGECCLTVELTSAEWKHEDGVLLIGDLDIVNTRN